MSVVLIEGGYADINEVYMRKTKSDEYERDVGLPEDGWTLFDSNGRKCVSAFDRSALFFWAHNHDIQIATVH